MSLKSLVQICLQHCDYLEHAAVDKHAVPKNYLLDCQR